MKKYTKNCTRCKKSFSLPTWRGFFRAKYCKTCKVIVKKIQDSLPPLETKPKSEAAQAMLKGIAKAKNAVS